MPRTSIARLLSLVSLPVLSLAAGALPGSALAVGTRNFEINSMEDLSAGDLQGVAVDSHGSIRAGFDLGKVPITDAPTAWSSLQIADGSVLIGTGNEGKIMRVTGGQVSTAATTGEMAVTSMVTAWNGDVIASTFPHGKLFKLPKGSGKGDKAALFATLEGNDYVWALAYDEKTKSLYAATGPDGKVLKIDEQGKSQVYFKSEDAHIVSLAVADNGTVYAGTSGKALLYSISSPGHATVFYDFDAEDVSGISVAKDGTVWAIANKYGGSFSLPSKGSNSAGPMSSRPKGGEGVLYRFKNGVSEEMMSDKKTHFERLALDDAGLAYVGTGSDGKVYTVDDGHLVRMLAKTDSRQIASLVVAGKKPYLVGSDPVVYREIKGEGGTDAVWTSKVLDAGLQANYGNLRWRGNGAIEMSVRSGNTQEPDATWAAWSTGMTAPGKTKLPAGRYSQIRARFKDGKSEVDEIGMSFVTENARAIVTNITAESRLQKKSSLGTGLVGSGGKSPKPSTQISLKWETENPDKDELRYRVSYRLEGQAEWRDALKAGEVLTGTSTEWETNALPEGLYRIKVEATDELVNPPERVTRHSLESSTVLVDNTPPVFHSLNLAGRKLSGEVADGLGPIARIEVSVAGSEEWRPIFPVDQVFDDATEKFDTDISSIVPAGSHLVGVRAFDAAGNSVTKEIEAK